MKWNKNSLSYLAPRGFAAMDPLTQEDFILLTRMILIVLIFSVFYFIYALKLDIFYLKIAMIYNVSTNLLALYLIKFKGSKKLAGAFFLLSILLTFLLVYVAGNGGASPGIVWFVLFPVMAIASTSVKEGVIWTTVSTICAVIITIYMHNHNIDMKIYTEHKLFIARTMNIILAPLIVFYMASYIYKSRHVLMEKLKDKADDLESVNNENKKLLSIMVHDLANPLMIIKLSNLRMMKDDRDDELIERCTEKIDQGVSVLEEIIGDIREMRAITEGKKSYTMEPIKLQLLEQRVRLLFDKVFQEKDLALNVKYNGLENFVYTTHFSTLSNNIIQNLISNAIKFSEQGEVIDLVFDKVDSHFCLIVKNRGPQIPLEKQTQLFSYTTATSSKGTLGESGTGFGLPIVYQAVKQLQGEVLVKSDTVETTFTVLLPI